MDFTTGTNMQVSIKSSTEVSVDAVRELLTDAGYGSAIVQESSEAGVDDPNRFLIRVSEGVDLEGGEGSTTTVSDGLQTALASLSDVTSESLNDKVEILQSAKARRPELRVMTLDYWDPEDPEGIRRIYRVQRANGFEPYVASIELDRIVTEPGN